MATTNWGAAPSIGQTTAPAAGLLGQQVTPTGGPFTQAGDKSSGVVPGTQAAQAQANLQSVDPSQTVAGGLDKMLAADSPYMQRAKTGAAQTSNARGLLNSSMAATAGEAAAIDAAAPIAQADAGLYADSRNRNQEALNSTGQFNSSQANQFSLADKSIQAEAARAATQQQYTQANMGMQQGFDLTKMDKAAATTLSQMTFQQQNDLAKLAVAQGYNIENMNAQQINDLAKQRDAQVFTAGQSAIDRTHQVALADKNFVNQQTLQASQNTFTAGQAGLDRAQQAYLQDTANAHQAAMTQMQQTFTSSQSALDRQNQAYLQDDAQAFQANLQNSVIPSNFALQISSSTMQSVNSIAADPNLSGTVDNQAPAGSSPKSRAIQSTLNYANSQIAWASKFYGATIPELPTSAAPSATTGPAVYMAPVARTPAKFANQLV